MSIKFRCGKGKDDVLLRDAKDVYYQYTSRGGVMAKGVCSKHGTNLAVFISKDKVPAGEKIRPASPSSGKKSHKSKKSGSREEKCGAKRSHKSKKSNKSRKSRRSHKSKK